MRKKRERGERNVGVGVDVIISVIVVIFVRSFI